MFFENKGVNKLHHPLGSGTMLVIWI